MSAQQTARQRMNAVIARQDIARGRALTDRERLDNLARALAEYPDTPCPECGVFDSDPCPRELRGRRCGLEA